MTKKLAVVLLNMGGPLKKADIKPFLLHFFMDKNIITAPFFIRFLLAHYIAIKRSKKEALTAYAELGYKSPLLENTEKQAAALEKELNKQFDDVKVFTSMRYWHPMASEVVGKVKEYNPEQVFLLPLYPQYSTATSKSSLENWEKEAKKQNLTCETKYISCYHLDDGFINASVDNIKQVYNDALNKNSDIKYRVLFSAHGLPEKTIAAGDPYQKQCEESASKISESLSIDNLDWQICYQSRVGRLKWIGPSTIEALEKAAKDKVGVIIYPHAFVSEHVETLVEIEQEYKALAKKLGVPDFIRVETVGTHPKFIKGLAKITGETICEQEV